MNYYVTVLSESVKILFDFILIYTKFIFKLNIDLNLNIK